MAPAPLCREMVGGIDAEGAPMRDSPSRFRRGLLMLGLCAPLAAETLEVGMPAPDFTLTDAGNMPHRLGDYSGKWLVLYFYPKNDTPGCTTEACAFRDDLKLIHELGAQVVGVSVDDAESHREFKDKYDLPFVLLSDADGEVADRYGARGGLLGMVFAKRHTFLIDPDGIVRHIWRVVRPRNHARDVIATLESLQ